MCSEWCVLVSLHNMYEDSTIGQRSGIVEVAQVAIQELIFLLMATFSLQIITSSTIKDEINKPTIHKAYKKNEGKIFGGQFQDGISNAVDVLSIIRSD